MSRKLATNGILGHGDTGEIILIQLSGGNGSETEVTHDFAQVHDFLTALTSGNALSLANMSSAHVTAQAKITWTQHATFSAI
jgi:hypothetical protein